MNVSNNNSNDSFREFRPEKSKQCSKLFTHRANLQLLNFCISDKSSTSLKWHSVHHISHYIHFAFITYIITVRYILGDWNSVRKINRQTEHFKVNVKRKLCLSFISCCDVYASEIAYWTSKKKKKNVMNGLILSIRNWMDHCCLLVISCERQIAGRGKLKHVWLLDIIFQPSHVLTPNSSYKDAWSGPLGITF